MTGVSWCPEDFFQVASCADDSCVRLWSVARGKDGPAVPRRLVALPSAPAASSDSTYPSAPRLDGLPAVARRPLVPVGNLPSPPSPLGLVGRKSPGGTGIAPQARVAPAASGFSPAGSTESGASGAFSSSRWLARNSTPLLRLDGSPAKGGTPGSQPKPLRLGYEDIRPRNLVQATLPDFLLPTTPVAKPLAAPREPGQLSISQFLAARPDKKRQQGSRASIRGQQAKRNKP